MQTVQLKKTIYGLNQINKVIKTDFTQLADTAFNPASLADSDEIDVPKFFINYNTLFYDIPISGSDESHLGIATRSLEYIGVSLDDLQNEINILRDENIELKNQIIKLSQVSTGSLQL
jgi:hypothetical protein